MLVKTLKWPFIGVFIAGALHTSRWKPSGPICRASIRRPSWGSYSLLWDLAGYMAVRNGGNFLTAILYGALLGLFPLVVNPLSFGMMLGRGFYATSWPAVFGFSMMLFGSLVGGGFAVEHERIENGRLPKLRIQVPLTRQVHGP